MIGLIKQVVPKDKKYKDLKNICYDTVWTQVFDMAKSYNLDLTSVEDIKLTYRQEYID